MKLKIKVLELNKAINLTNRVVSKNPVIPITGYLLMEFLRVGNTMMGNLIADNSEDRIEHFFSIEDIKDDETFPFMIMNPFKLQQFISNYDKEDIMIIEIKENILHIKINKNKIKLPVNLKTDDFSKPEEEKEKSIKITSYKQFLKDIKIVSKFIAKDELRPVMETIHINKEDIVATDSHKLIRKHIQYDNDNNLSINIRRSFVDLLPNISKDTEFELFIGEKSLRTEIGDVIIYSRLTEGAYPAYNSVIPTDFNYKIKIPFAKFKNEISQANIFSNNASGLIAITFDKENITIKTEDVDFAYAFNCDFDHNGFEGTVVDEPFSIGFKGLFLEEILNSMEAEEEFTIVLSDPSRAALLEDDNKNNTYLLMPMMLA